MIPFLQTWSVFVALAWMRLPTGTVWCNAFFSLDLLDETGLLTPRVGYPDALVERALEFSGLVVRGLLLKFSFTESNGWPAFEYEVDSWELSLEVLPDPNLVALSAVRGLFPVGRDTSLNAVSAVDGLFKILANVGVLILSAVPGLETEALRGKRTGVLER